MGGPFERQVGSLDTPFSSTRIWYTQAKPYVKPLYHEYSYQQALSGRDKRSGGYQAVLNPSSPNSTFSSAVANALKRLRESIGSAASNAVNAAEYAKSQDMIVRRVTQVTRAARQIRKRRFKEAARTLGITQPKGASRKKQFSDNFLEYNFGWAPMIGDIFESCKAFVRDIPSGKCRGRAKSTWTDTQGHWPPNPSGPTGRSGVQSYYVERIHVGATVRVTNSDLWLANQLGLLNPASVAWELVPFSFVVDWFYDVGSFLDSLTCMVGLEVTNDFQTRSTSCFRKYWYLDNAYAPPWKPIFGLQTGSSFILRRTLGLPAFPAPEVQLPHISVRRAVTAVSLLIQQLK